MGSNVRCSYCREVLVYDAELATDEDGFAAHPQCHASADAERDQLSLVITSNRRTEIVLISGGGLLTWRKVDVLTSTGTDQTTEHWEAKP